MIDYQRMTLVVAVVVSFAGPVNGSQQVRTESRRPNIVILLADDLGYADVGYHGCRDIPTPNIDALANGGTRFTNAYVSCPLCSPSRAGLMTGRYQQRFGHEFNPPEQPAPGAQPPGLPHPEKTIADYLKSAGYVTGLIGKWHLGRRPEYRPQRRGFDEFFGFLGGGHTYFPGTGRPILRGDNPIEEPQYLTDAIAREAISFIQRHQREPFFLYVPFNAVHTPLQAPADRLERFASIAGDRRRTYAGMLAAMDEAVGGVLGALRSAGLEENTLIFFFNDNGGPTMLGTTINGSRNAPLRGSKRTTLEGGIRVPFVMHWKGRIPKGHVFDQPIIQLDILPTALAAAGIVPRAEWKLDGVNLLPHLTGEIKSAPHENLYWRFGDQMALRQGPWKIVSYDPAADAKPTNTRREVHLYNLATDVGEAHDLTAEHPEKVTELKALWQAWSNTLARPLWGPADQIDD